MADLYLLDRPFGSSGLKLAVGDEGAAIVLIQDGVTLDLRSLDGSQRRVYALGPDMDKRGKLIRLPGFVEIIGYDRLVDLIFENKVVNFA